MIIVKEREVCTHQRHLPWARWRHRDPGQVARNESVTTFVKRGAKEARITIELHNSKDGDNWEVGSVITSKGKITWTLGGERATKSQV